MMRHIIKHTLFVLLIYLVFCFQAAFSPLFAPLGAEPELLPVLLGCICVLEAPSAAALFGLFAGILRDTISASGLYFSLLYHLSAPAAALLIRRQLRPCAALCLLMGCTLSFLSDLPFFLAALFLPGADLLSALKSAGLHLAYTLGFFFPMYRLCLILHAAAPEPEHAGQKLPAARIKNYVNRGGKRHAVR